MNKQELQQLIREEIQSVLKEESPKYASLLDPAKFDPIDPEISIHGYGTLSRSNLRKKIVDKLKGAVQTATEASKGTAMSYENYKALDYLIGEKGLLTIFVRSEIEVAEQLEAKRKKGGRRAQPIPKQF